VTSFCPRIPSSSWYMYTTTSHVPTLGQMLFFRKSSGHKLFFRNTHFFTFNYLRDVYCFSSIWVAGLFARWQDYAVTLVSQFFKFWTYAVFPGSDPIVKGHQVMYTNQPNIHGLTVKICYSVEMYKNVVKIIRNQVGMYITKTWV
jgi:hypothetical protein